MKGKWALPALSLGAGLAALSVSITDPILSNMATALGVSVPLLGQLVPIASLAGVGGNLLLSPLLDRASRRDTLTLAMSGIVFSSLACAIAPSFITLAVAYCVLGLSAFTLLALVLASTGDLYQAEGMGRAMGWVVAGNVGIMMAGLPLAAALAQAFTWRLAFMFLAAVAALATVFIHRAVPSGLRPGQRPRVGYAGAFREVLDNRGAFLLLLTVGLVHSSYYGLRRYLEPAAVSQLGLDSLKVAPVFSLFNLGTALAGVFAGRLLRDSDWRLPSAAALACAILAVLVYRMPGGFAVFAVLASLYGFAFGFLDVGMNSLLASWQGGGRGVVMALRSVMDSLGGVCGPALGGVVVASEGYRAAGWAFSALALSAAVTVAIVARRPRVPSGLERTADAVHVHDHRVE